MSTVDVHERASSSSSSSTVSFDDIMDLEARLAAMDEDYAALDAEEFDSDEEDDEVEIGRHIEELQEMLVAANARIAAALAEAAVPIPEEVD